jgi:hypothetical protein
MQIKVDENGGFPGGNQHRGDTVGWRRWERGQHSGAEEQLPHSGQYKGPDISMKSST